MIELDVIFTVALAMGLCKGTLDEDAVDEKLALEDLFVDWLIAEIVEDATVELTLFEVIVLLLV